MYWNPIWHQSLIVSPLGGKLFGAKKTVVFTLEVPFDAEGLRLHFSNLYGKIDYRLKVTANNTAVTVNGDSEIVVPTGKSIFSDEAVFTVKRGENICFKVYYDTPVTDMNMIEPEATLLKGDYTDKKIKPGKVKAPLLAKLLGVYNAIPSVDLIELKSVFQSGSIVAFGDSITSLSLWTGPLAKRLVDEYDGEYVLLNSGISGNCLLYERPDFMAPLFGKKGTERFEKDVLEIPNLKCVIFALGVNDVSYYTEKTKDIINLSVFRSAVTDIVDRLHERGVRVTAMTITPRLGVSRIMGKYYPEMEVQRLMFNEWLRSTGIFDYVYDDEVLVREEHPDGYYYCEGLHRGDHLHPNEAGGKIIADGFDLRSITG